MSVGRHKENDQVINSSSVSRRHLKIELIEGVYNLIDTDSSFGTNTRINSLIVLDTKNYSHLDIDNFEIIFKKIDPQSRKVQFTVIEFKNENEKPEYNFSVSFPPGLSLFIGNQPNLPTISQCNEELSTRFINLTEASNSELISPQEAQIYFMG